MKFLEKWNQQVLNVLVCGIGDNYFKTHPMVQMLIKK